MFKKVLIANRGEIACRIARTCRRLGIGSVAVFSSADEHALHRRSADESVAIGGAESKDSYLSIERIIDAALKTGAEAIHPGYGFLAENTVFAEALHQAGLKLIGPAPQVIALMGDKIAAKALAAQAQVPLVPGITLAAQAASAAENVHAVEAFAQQYGYPILVKAASGGGGRGMRRVESVAEIEPALAGAAREAQAFFADGRVFVEKLVEHARHIEVQIMGDSSGTVLVLGDRDCSLQRNHQKVIEEAPAANLPPELRAAIHDAARRLGQLSKYENAGTVEFLLDQERNFYFLEVNSRLQVEHPVTEAVTGLDLVEIQLRVAAGEKLGAILPRGVPEPCGAAIECRICAESPEDNFVASTGRLELFMPPNGKHVRFDTGFMTGDAVSHYYDSLLGKLIVSGADRGEAIRASVEALHQLRAFGVKTNVGFLLSLLNDGAVQAMEHETHYATTLLPAVASRRREGARAAALALIERLRERAGAELDPWQTNSGFRLAGSPRIAATFVVNKETIQATLSRHGNTGYSVSAGEISFTLNDLAFAPIGFSFTVDGHSECAEVFAGRSGIWVKTPRGTCSLEEIQPALKKRETDPLAHAREIRSPLPGKVVSIKAAVGDPLEAGDTVLVIESMKMEHLLKAPTAGKVKAIKALPGDVVEANTVLVELDF
jgi:3-methylcrotonyl-CoA carboxylase alpha subunit/geranyl-CoA carboxylase alpha subunit